MNMWNVLIRLLAVLALTFAFAGCDEMEDAAQDTGEAVEDAAHDTGEAMEDAADETGDAVEKAVDEVDDEM